MHGKRNIKLRNIILYYYSTHQFTAQGIRYICITEFTPLYLRMR